MVWNRNCVKISEFLYYVTCTSNRYSYNELFSFFHSFSLSLFTFSVSLCFPFVFLFFRLYYSLPLSLSDPNARSESLSRSLIYAASGTQLLISSFALYQRQKYSTNKIPHENAGSACANERMFAY